MSQSKEGSHRRRTSSSSQKLLSEFYPEGFEVDQALPHGQTITKVEKRLKDVRNGLNTSKELLKIINRISGNEEKSPTCVTLFSALKSELDQACIQVNKLIQHQTSNITVIDLLLKEFAEEKRAWKIKERDRIRNAIMSIAGELEIEKKLRRQSERLNKKLGTELADIKKELESEKRAREILEQACDELAEGIDEDRAEAEELKKVREEVEKEREMLQLADVLREERVQMKLSEAKYEFEEKNAILDKLKSELEFKIGEGRSYESPNYDCIKELKRYLNETLPNPYPYQDKEKNDGIVQEEDDSDYSDLCSIELNVDDVVQNGSKRKSIDKKHSRRNFTAEKIQRQSVSTEDGIEWNSEILNKSRLFEINPSEPWRKNYGDEIEKYKMIKDLRDHVVSGSLQEVDSSRKQWGQQHNLPSEDVVNRLLSKGLSV